MAQNADNSEDLQGCESSEPSDAAEPDRDAPDRGRRALLRAGWTVPVVLAVTPARSFALSPVAHADTPAGHQDSDPTAHNDTTPNHDDGTSYGPPPFHNDTTPGGPSPHTDSTYTFTQGHYDTPIAPHVDA